MKHQNAPYLSAVNVQKLKLRKDIHVIYRMGGPYWKNILSRSQKRPEVEGRGTFLRPRQNIFPVRTDLNGK